jgi:hypothetical protein
MRKLLFAGIALAAPLAGWQFAQAAPTGHMAAANSAVVAPDTSVQKAYWVWRNGRYVWRPAPYVYRPVLRHRWAGYWVPPRWVPGHWRYGYWVPPHWVPGHYA